MRKDENESLRIQIVNSLVRSEFKDDNTYEGAKYIVNKVLEILKRPEFKERETNLEHFKGELKTLLRRDYARPQTVFDKIQRSLDYSIESGGAFDLYTDLIIDWMSQPYNELKRPSYELTRAEYDVLLSAPRCYPIKELTTLNRLKEEHGWFKNIDSSLKPSDILDFCIISNEKKEKSDENS